MDQYTDGQEFISGNTLKRILGLLFGKIRRVFATIARHMKSIDGYFVLSYMLDTGLKPEIITKNNYNAALFFQHWTF